MMIIKAVCSKCEKEEIIIKSDFVSFAKEALVKFKRYCPNCKKLMVIIQEKINKVKEIE